MPDIRTHLGQYCAICHYTHKEEYLVCDFCNEHKTWIYLKDRYYNYGFCKRSYMHAMNVMTLYLAHLGLLTAVL